MENNKSKAKYIGQIAAIIMLEAIMLLFRLVQPIRWPSGISMTWQSFGNELIFFGIELGLIVVIVAHLIFKYSFKEMGLIGFKKNIVPLVINLGFVGACVGAGYLGSQFSKSIEFDALNITLQIIANFIAIAFLKELIFRSVLFNITLKVTKNNGMIASIITALLFTLTYIPDVLLNLDEIQGMTILSALVGPFILGLYLNLIYIYGKNLWICMMIHGVCLSIASFETDIFITILAGGYLASLFIYLVYKMVVFYRRNHEDEHCEASEEFITELQDELIMPLEEEEAVEPLNETKEEMIEETILASQNHLSYMQTELEKKGRLNKEVEVSNSVEETKSKVIEMPNFRKQLLTPAEKLKQEVAEVLETTLDLGNLIVESETEDDLQQMTALSNNKEELGKVVNLQARKEQLARAGKIPKNLDDTVVIPSISDETNKNKMLRSGIKEIGDIIEREPNFIAHLEQYLGEFEGIYKQVIPTDPPIDIMYFSGESCNAMVTNGMRAMPMAVPAELKDYRQVELMMFIDKSFDLSGEGVQKEENAWLIKLLTDLATYPRETNSYLGWGHIVGNGTHVEPYDESVDYCGALIYPPMDQENMKFYHYIEKNKNIFIYNVMPLFKEELRFIQEHSSDRFINLMGELGVKQRVMPKRINVVEEMNQR